MDAGARSGAVLPHRAAHRATAPADAPAAAPLLPRPCSSCFSADWTWEGKLPEKVTLGEGPQRPGDLDCRRKDAAGQTAVAVENPGFAEFLFDVEDPEPGTGVFLGDAQGRHLCRLGFFRHRETGQLAFELTPVYSSDTEKSYDIQRQVAPLAGRRQRYRIVAGAGMYTGWTSLDGTHWSQIGPVSIEGEGVCGQVGLYCLPGEKPRSITLCSLEVRRLDAMHPLAPAEVQKQVGNLAKFQRPREMGERGRPFRPRRASRPTSGGGPAP